MSYRCEVFPEQHLTKWLSLEKEISFLKGKVFLLEKNKEELTDEVINEVLVDPIYEFSSSQRPHYLEDIDFNWAVEVTYRPGVTDNQGITTQEAFALLGKDTRVFSGQIYLIKGGNREDVQKIANTRLGNTLIQSVRFFEKSELLSDSRFTEISLPMVNLDTSGEVKTIDLGGDDNSLIKISSDNCLALRLDEMQTIRDYYLSEEVSSQRKDLGLPSWPTDVELEVFAQTWSEHCKHKIFSANIDYNEDFEHESAKKYGNVKVGGLFKDFVKGVTDTVKEQRKLDWLISVFSDNAGIVRWDKNLDLCLKVETHNSPSALDPYGGALTGILGVNRDILGCGVGAKPIANTNVFCFADPNWPKAEDLSYMPKGVRHPAQILTGVHRGVEDGGNKSGIPTINGAFAFDRDFAGKPLVFVGTLGTLPNTVAGKPSHEKRARPGHHIVVVGGAVGRDGIHGATFSSLELDENAPATAVQIGDPLTQRRVTDFLLEARDRDLYSCVTDNGAGGISSSVGEMAELTGGAELHLDRHPLKYPGLLPFEIMISESQERMTFAVPEENLEELIELARSRNVIATSLGRFKDDGYLDVYYKEKLVGHFDMEFLHNGLPKMNLTANWKGPQPREDWRPAHVKEQSHLSGNLLNKMNHVLSHPNVSSKESYVRRYDHEVQAATFLKPFHTNSQGEKSAPNDAGGILLGPHGGEENNKVIVACGMASYVSHLDTRLMSLMAVDEAMRNLVASGVDPEKVAMLDNFCWPDPLEGPKNPHAHHKLGQLVRSCLGLKEICLAYGTPLISGKDSMKNDFKGVDEAGRPCHISVQPTLLVSAMGLGSLKNSVNAYASRPGDVILALRTVDPKLSVSLFHNDTSTEMPDWDEQELSQCMDNYLKLHQLIKEDAIKGLHDVSEGGAMTAISEMLFANQLGATLEWMGATDDDLFGEGLGNFILTVDPERAHQIEQNFDGKVQRLGVIQDDPQLEVDFGDRKEKLNVDDLYKTWKQEVIK